MDYKLYEFGESTVEHDLEFENIADIQCCLGIVHKLKQLGDISSSGKYSLSKSHIILMQSIVKNIPNIECLPETIQKMSKVTVPETDY